MPLTYSLHKITNTELFGFCPMEYSRFKFGDEAIAKNFGERLAKGFIRDHLSVAPIKNQIVVISSPYSYIPTATFAMKNHFVFQLNRWLVENGCPVVQETKVHRTITYKEDYGELNAEQRINLISNDSFHIDKQFLESKTLIFLDDIKITGSHERMIVNMIKQYKLDNRVMMLYFAELTNLSIHPNIENHLNYSYVKSIFDLNDIIRSGRFFINTRIVKYILNHEFSGFRIFIEEQSEEFINLLYNMAIGNGYHTIEAYAQNLDYLKNYLITKPHKLMSYGD